MAIGSSENAAADSSASEDRYLAAPSDGMRLRYRDEGSGPAVLLIHGWTLDLNMWDPQVSELRDRFRLIRFDRRGFGLSAGVPSLLADVRDALVLCRSLGLQRFACVGMSQGARVALRMTRQAPEVLSCVVLDGPPELFVTDQAEMPPLSDYRTKVTPEGIQTFREHWRRHPLMQLWNADQCHRRLLDRMIDRYPGRDLEAHTPTDRLPIDMRQLGLIRTATLVVGGEYDSQSRQDAADKLATAIPAALRVIVRGAGHLPNLDNPHVYNGVLSNFLGGHAT
jgi:pimeloyl-ACP methyl ester carboxylesterase